MFYIIINNINNTHTKKKIDTFIATVLINADENDINELHKPTNNFKIDATVTYVR